MNPSARSSSSRFEVCVSVLPDFSRVLASWRHCSAALAIIAALSFAPERASAQLASTAVGFVGGLVTGAHITTGIYVFRTRATGWELHAIEDMISANVSALPIVIFPIAGAVVGNRSSTRLAAAATWGGAGLVGGAVVGTVIGHLVWGDSQGRWAGGTMGSATGLALGVILGAALKRSASDGGEQEGIAAPLVTISLPLGGPR
jgi:hypothetical protein